MALEIVRTSVHLIAQRANLEGNADDSGRVKQAGSLGTTDLFGSMGGTPHFGIGGDGARRACASVMNGVGDMGDSWRERNALLASISRH